MDPLYIAVVMPLVAAWCVVIFFLFYKPCLFRHDWTINYTCGTYDRTGPMPGESITSDQGWGIHRLERHCITCNRADYKKDGKEWVTLPVPLFPKS